jgi:putative glutamine amidotransferase
MKERLNIGIVGWSTGDNSFGVTKPYLSHIDLFGNPVILPPMEGVMKGIDVVVMPGGRDVSSHLYGKKPGYYNSDSDPFKEWFMTNNLEKYIAEGVPIWGTCLGFQQLVVHFGGWLDQNIDISRHGYSSESRDEQAHKLIINQKFDDIKEALLAKINERREKKVKFLSSNSLHHQGVTLKGVPSCFDVIAYTSDGYVEAIVHKELPIAAAQFHVEEDYNPLGMFMFKELTKAANYEGSYSKNKRKPVKELGESL